MTGKLTKRLRFTEEHIIDVLKEAEASVKTAGLVRKHGVLKATLYNWKASYGDLEGVGGEAASGAGR